MGQCQGTLVGACSSFSGPFWCVSPGPPGVLTLSLAAYRACFREILPLIEIAHRRHMAIGARPQIHVRRHTSRPEHWRNLGERLVDRNDADAMQHENTTRNHTPVSQESSRWRSPVDLGSKHHPLVPTNPSLTR